MFKAHWWDLGPVIQSDVSQKEENKHHLLILEPRKKCTDNPICIIGKEMQT